MAYTKNHVSWTATDAITISIMDNFETIHTEMTSYLTTHAHTGVYATISTMDSTYYWSGNTGHGTGADADVLYHVNGNMHATDFSGQGVPSGLIILWYGNTSAIPVGWKLCNGTEGTPDLRDRFIIGAGDTGAEYVVGDTGGGTTFAPSGSITVDAHILTIAQIGSHRHPWLDYYCEGISISSPTGSPTHYSSTLANRTGDTSSAGSDSGHTHSTIEGTAMTGTTVNSLPYYYALCYIKKS